MGGGQPSTPKRRVLTMETKSMTKKHGGLANAFPRDIPMNKSADDLLARQFLEFSTPFEGGWLQGRPKSQT